MYRCQLKPEVKKMARYEKEDFKRNMKIRLNFNNMMEKFVGEKGITEAELAALSEKIDFLSFSQLPLHPLHRVSSFILMYA